MEEGTRLPRPLCVSALQPRWPGLSPDPRLPRDPDFLDFQVAILIRDGRDPYQSTGRNEVGLEALLQRDDLLQLVEAVDDAGGLLERERLFLGLLAEPPLESQGVLVAI